jgi:putative oxidoreductase
MMRLGRFGYHAARLLLGAVFLYAGALKSQNLPAFADSIARYRLLPDLGNSLVAAVLPSVEFLAGLLLVVNRKVRPAAVVTALLTLVFAAALLSVLVRGLSIDCGCFGSGASSSAQAALWRDGGLFLLSLLIYRLAGRQGR